MVSIRARDLLFKTNFQIWQSGGRGENLPGSIPSATPSRAAAREGLRGLVRGGKKNQPKNPPQKWFALSLGKKQNPDPQTREGSAIVVLHKAGGEAAQRPRVAAPRWEGTRPRLPLRGMAMDTAIPPRTAATRQWFLYFRGAFS